MAERGCNNFWGIRYRRTAKLQELARTAISAIELQQGELRAPIFPGGAPDPRLVAGVTRVRDARHGVLGTLIGWTHAGMPTIGMRLATEISTPHDTPEWNVRVASAHARPCSCLEVRRLLCGGFPCGPASRHAGGSAIRPPACGHHDVGGSAHLMLKHVVEHIHAGDALRAYRLAQRRTHACRPQMHIR